MRYSDQLNKQLHAALEELRVSRQKVIDLTDDNQQLLTETKQVCNFSYIIFVDAFLVIHTVEVYSTFACQYCTLG